MRASLYNAVTYEDVQELVKYMQEFQRLHQREAALSN